MKKLLHKWFGWGDCFTNLWLVIDNIETNGEVNEFGGWWESIDSHCKVCGKKESHYMSACIHTTAFNKDIILPAYLDRCSCKGTKKKAEEFLKKQMKKYDHTITKS